MFMRVVLFPIWNIIYCYLFIVCAIGMRSLYQSNCLLKLYKYCLECSKFKLYLQSKLLQTRNWCHCILRFFFSSRLSDLCELHSMSIL
jgi:hypothetical protein